jgi:prephenate dehydrogenase
MPDPTVAVVGLGLIGGSLARDLAAGGIRVLGFDRNPRSLRAAGRAGAVHRPLTNDLAGLAEADAVVVAVPVSAAPDVLAAARPHLARATLVTDVGSTKRGIAAAAERLELGARFVGAHPLAGDHRAGWSASRAGLFRGARVFLCPAADAAPAAVRLARRLWRRVGATVEVTTPVAHDRRMAYASHVPQVVSSLMAVLLDRHGVAPAHLGPGGRDVLRLAGSSPELWAATLLENADRVGEALGALEEALVSLRAALGRGDRTRLWAMLAGARDWSRWKARASR